MINICKNVHTFTCVYVYIYIYIYMYLYKYICMYIYMYAYIPPDPRLEGRGSRPFFHFEGRESTLEAQSVPEGCWVRREGKELA